MSTTRFHEQPKLFGKFPISLIILISVTDFTGKGPGANVPSPGFAGGSGGGHGGLGGRAASQVTTGASYGSIKEPNDFGELD